MYFGNVISNTFYIFFIMYEFLPTTSFAMCTWFTPQNVAVDSNTCLYPIPLDLWLAAKSYFQKNTEVVLHPRNQEIVRDRKDAGRPVEPNIILQLSRLIGLWLLRYFIQKSKWISEWFTFWRKIQMEMCSFYFCWCFHSSSFFFRRNLLFQDIISLSSYKVLYEDKLR